MPCLDKNECVESQPTKKHQHASQDAFESTNPPEDVSPVSKLKEPPTEIQTDDQRGVVWCENIMNV